MAMRAGWIWGAALAAGCSFKGLADSDGPIDSPGSVIADAGADASGVVGWSLHTRAEFDDPGADPTGAIYDQTASSSHDVLEPVAYQILGLLGHAANTQLFNNADEPWSTFTGATPTATSSIHNPISNYAGGFPIGLGITDPEGYTAWWEGEVLLEAGNHNLVIDSDDEGFVEIELPTGAVRATDDCCSTGETVTLSVPADGYYPIRIALAEYIGSSRLLVQHQPPGATALGLMSQGRMRTRASKLAGAMRYGFDGKLLGDPRGQSRFESALIDEDYAGGFPGEVGITDHDRWSQRVAGQVWVDVDGTYAVQVNCEAGYRVIVDGAVVSDPARFDDVAHDDLVTIGPLTRGWHDLAIDHQDNTGNTDLRVELVAPSPVTGTINASLIRPVTSGRERIASDGSVPGRDNLPGFAVAAVAGGRFSELIELAVTYEIDHPAWEEFTVTLTSPWGTTALIRDHVVQSGNGTQVVTQLVPAALIPANPGGDRPATGPWRIDVDDDMDTDEGALIRLAVTARYRSGPAAIATASRYTSGVHDFGSARSITGLTATASTPVGASAAISLRSCESLPCTTPFVPAEAMTFPLPAARYAQVQVDFVSDGIESPFVDDIDVYVAP